MKFRATGHTKGFNMHFDDTDEKLKIQLDESGTTTPFMTLVGPQGYVGIGTDSPGAKLNVLHTTGTTGTGKHIIARLDLSCDAGTTVSNGYGASLRWGVPRDAGGPHESGYMDCYIYSGANTNGDFYAYDFRLRNDNTIDTVMTMRSNGKVGIGTDSPAKQLHIHNGNTNEVVELLLTCHASGSTENDGLRILQGSSAEFHQQEPSGQIKFFTHGSAAPVIEIGANGNVVIGGHESAANTSAKLDVNGTVKATTFDGTASDAITAATATALVGISNSNIVQKNASTTSMSGGLEIEGTFRTINFGPPTYLSWAIGLDVDLYIFCGVSSSLLTSSDERIKTNIVDCSNSLALDKFRQLEMKYYNYKDTSKHGTYKTIGIIAQKLKEVFPSAVGILENAIPDELKDIDTTEWETIDTNNNIYKLNTNIENAAGIKYRFYVGDNRKKKDIIANSDGTFTFDKKYDNIYCYGKVVNDFHIVNKEKLYMYNISATQEIDRIQQEEKTKLAAAEAEITTLKTQLAAVLARLDALESN